MGAHGGPTLLLGVDGGNTKSVALLAAADGSIVGAGRVEGSTDIHHVPFDVALGRLTEAIEAASRTARTIPRSVAFGLAGADWPEDIAALEDGLRALWPNAVVVNDAPGFASSRLGVAIALEAMRMVEEGVASAEDIDAAMVLGYKHPVGPLKTTDIVGLDVRLGIAEYLHSTLGERFAPPQILRDKVAKGELGRKSGKGFFSWDS